MQQAYPQAGLQLTYVPAQGGLRDAQLNGRVGDALVLGDGIEIAQLFDIQNIYLQGKGKTSSILIQLCTI
jgi:hypothetical protein